MARALKKIRKGYNDYIVTYMKTPRAKEDFERRYFIAAKYKDDMARFLKTEIEILNDLVLREEEAHREKKRTEQLKESRRIRYKNGGFADRILQQLEDKIKSYPDADITDEASMEIKKLYGAIQLLESQHWNTICRFIRELNSLDRSIERLENILWSLVPRAGKSPAALDRYLFLLSRDEPDLQAIAIEEQECMKKAAFFLNELLQIYNMNREQLIPESPSEVSFHFINQMVFNFRLFDIKKS